jgi:hypothetical protein
MISQQHQESVFVVLAGLECFKDQSHHIVHLSLLVDHVWGSRSAHVPDVIDPKIVEDHRVPVAFFQFGCNVAGDVMIDFGVFLCVRPSDHVNERTGV